VLLGRINQMKSTWANNSVKWELGTWSGAARDSGDTEGYREIYSGDSGVPSVGWFRSVCGT